jgi:hypothetical protein
MRAAIERECVPRWRARNARVSNGAQDSDAKAFASATLPTLRMHLRKINAIAADAGVTK